MGMIKEFKKFAIKGNMIDMAVGIIIGGAFSTIVGSLVSDLIMPPVGLMTAGVNFKEYGVKLGEDGDGKPLELKVGSFIDNVIKFLIVAFAVFMLVKVVNAMKRKEEAAAPPSPPKQELLLEEIRDLLKKA